MGAEACLQGHPRRFELTDGQFHLLALAQDLPPFADALILADAKTDLGEHSRFFAAIGPDSSG
jgi:hypothetical protein